MPTISQLPTAGAISEADEVPISQGGVARAVSIGALLSSSQSVIVVNSPALLRRKSLGSGGPEQIDVGAGLSLPDGTLVAASLDYANFPLASSLPSQSDLVISNQGTPMLMQASMLRGLFSAGQNVTIDPNGIISAAGISTEIGNIVSVSSIGALQVITQLSSQDLVAVSHAGSEFAISYDNFLDGITIDQAQSAAAVTDLDTTWVAQGSNVMARQTFGAIWSWIAGKLPTYRSPVVEIASNINLDASVHNGRLLICSQPVTLTPLSTTMGSGFQCTVINMSSGNVILGSGFVSSSGSLMLSPGQSAMLSCATYSGGTIAFAAMPTTTFATATSPPGQVVGLFSSGSTASSITVSWQAPSTGGSVSSYIIGYRITGTNSWAYNTSIAGVMVSQLTGLQPGTSYDVNVQAQNVSGTGTASSILTVVTPAFTQTSAPQQVIGLTTSSISANTIQLNWSAQTGSAAAMSFTVQYRTTGSSTWTSSVAGISSTGTSITGLQASTSYDFQVFGVNSVGGGPVSSTLTAATIAASQSVSSITWNLLPSATYTHGIGSIGVNAQISPSSAPVQFGFSLSSSTPPTSWTTGLLVNTNLWGAYIPTPPSAGSWYVWGQGLDGSARTSSPSPFTVQ